MKVKAIKHPKGSQRPFSILELEHPKTKEKLNVYIDHKSAKGGTAKVKPGFVDPVSKKPKYAIKIIHPDIKGQETIAKKEAESHALFGETAFYFSRIGKNGEVKWCALEPWCEGEELMKYVTKVQNWCKESKIKMDPCLNLLERFKALFRILKLIEILHLRKKVHGDLKPHNFIIHIDYSKKTLKSIKLIDKASIHDEGALGKEIVFTADFLPLELLQKASGSEVIKNLTQAEDIFALGVIAGLMFPEYCNVSPPVIQKGKMRACSIEKQATDDKSAISSKVISLFQSMSAPDRKHRPNINQCIKNLQIITSEFILEEFKRHVKKIEEESITSEIKIEKIGSLTREVLSLNGEFEFKGELNPITEFYKKFAKHQASENSFKFNFAPPSNGICSSEVRDKYVEMALEPPETPEISMSIS
jgi:serine/threonine protein kinase